MRERGRGPSWLFYTEVLFGALTAILIGIGLGAPDISQQDRLILLAAMLAFFGFVAIAAWTAAGRESQPGGKREQADTASKIAHELKNPLASIKGLASTGAKLYDSMSDEERVEFFGLIDDEAERLKRTIEEVSTALKIDAGTISYETRSEDLGKLVREVAWSTPCGDHPIEVQADDGIVITLDRLRISEVLGILLENASRFSPPDAPIEVRVARASSNALVEVSDHGPGIPPEQRRAVFEKFARWRPAGYEETPGAGLGLFIARAHVLAHGGQMAVEERAEGGTMLRITLPGGR